MIFHLLFFSRRLPFRTFYSVFIQYVWFGGKRHRETQLDNGKREEWGGDIVHILGPTGVGGLYQGLLGIPLAVSPMI